MNDESYSEATSDQQSTANAVVARQPLGARLRATVCLPITLQRLLVCLWALSVLTGLAILLVPEKPREPLVPRDNWTVQGGFVESLRPTRGEVSRSILRNSQSVFWSSWSPETGSMPGRVVSPPFRVPRFFAVPFTGYPDHLGVEVYLECLDNKKRLNIAHGNAHDRWVERTIRRPDSWCTSDSRLVASSTAPRKELYVGVGTPFRSSRLAWFKESAFVVVFIHALGCILLLGPGFMVAWLMGTREFEKSLLIAVPMTLLMGYFAFFGFYYGAVIAQIFVLLVAFSSAFLLLLKWRLFLSYWNRSGSTTPFRLLFGLSLVYALLLYSADLGVGSFTANYRFAPAVWSTDNQLPQIVAETLYSHGSIKSLLGTEWKVSDRPPLMSGLFLLARPVWQPLIAVGENVRLRFYFYQVTGIVLSTLWVVSIWLLLKSVRTSSYEASIVVIALAMTGFVLFNSTYVWPKMLSGALALSAYLAYRWLDFDGQYYPFTPFITAGILFGLALLAHSGVVFGIIPLFVLGAMQRGANRIRGSVTTIAVIAVVITPWLLWQRFEDPPGNALAKFALAGTFGFGEEAKGLITTIREAYSQLSFGEWLRLRWQAVLTLFGAFRHPLITWLWLSPMDIIGQLRLAEFAFLIPALSLGNFGWFILAPPLLRVRRDGAASGSRELHFGYWLLIGVVGIALNVFATWHLYTTWHQSYVSVLLMMTALYSALVLKSQSLGRVVLAGQFGYLTVVWLWSPLADLPLRHDFLAGWLLSVLGLCLMISRTSGDADADRKAQPNT